MIHIDDELAHADHPTMRAQLAESLDERRVELANDVVTRLTQSHGMMVSALIVRTLVHALAKSVADGSPDQIVHWSRMVRHAHPAAVVVAMIDAACEAAEMAAADLPGDLGAAIVFFEIVKARARSLAVDEAVTVEEVETSGVAAISSLLAMLRSRDDATCSHSQATGEWSRRIAARIGLPPETVKRVQRAGVLHDIGKIRVPDSILFKAGPLETSEWEIMKRHAEAGADILSQIPTLAQFGPIVAAHHERADGRGYPHGLRASEILLETKVVSVADSFHAMVTDRPYRTGFSYGEAMTILADGRGTQWDADIADVMIALAAEDRHKSADADLLGGPPFYELAPAAMTITQYEDERQAV
jgi:putative nucleotidyltransferase with HDIG domain